MYTRRAWQMLRHSNFLLVIVVLFIGNLVSCSNSTSGGTGDIFQNTTQVTLAPIATQPTRTETQGSPLSFLGLEDDATQWNIFYDRGTATAKLDNVTDPSVDGTALKISLVSGNPYTGVHAYQNLLIVNASTVFDLNLSFYLNDVAPIQDLEFTTSKWLNHQRWELALQWERIGDGTPQQGNPPTWRLWTGSDWQDTGVRQELSTNTWHNLHIYGEISNGQVHYISFSCDSTSANLGQTFAPVSSPDEDKLAVAVQLGGNSHEDAYQVVIDRVNLLWG